jgi:hypothetical protein
MATIGFGSPCGSPHGGLPLWQCSFAWQDSPFIFIPLKPSQSGRPFTEASMSDSESSILGTWKLLSLDIEFQASGDRQQPYGPNPDGYLILTPEGRMMAVVAAKGRKPGLKVEEQAELLRTLLAYTGTYKLSGNRFVTKVDVSWNEAWSGTEQERFFEVKGDRLSIVTAWLPNPNLPGGPIVRGGLTFARAR